MGYKAAVFLGFLAHLTAARVVCSFSVVAADGDTCSTLASSWAQTLDDFQTVNPSASCPDLTVGQRYCILGEVNDEPEPTPVTTMTTSASATASPTYEPAMPGIPSDCDEFHLLKSGDQCFTLETQFGITDSQLRAWNPTINKSCSNLRADYYICVHVQGAPTSTEPSPQRPGIVSNCKDFYKVKSGDTCYSIDVAAGITLDQFRSWNTQIDAGCTNLWAEYYVCTAV